MKTRERACPVRPDGSSGKNAPSVSNRVRQALTAIVLGFLCCIKWEEQPQIDIPATWDSNVQIEIPLKPPPTDESLQPLKEQPDTRVMDEIWVNQLLQDLAPARLRDILLLTPETEWMFWQRLQLQREGVQK